jgi:hypothetical protein
MKRLISDFQTRKVRRARVTTAAERALSVRSEDHEGTRADCVEES